jgi:tagatose-1,6-bisphosphate aldolase non-catalytic subunit AgaZ/GatZ
MTPETLRTVYGNPPHFDAYLESVALGEDTLGPTEWEDFRAAAAEPDGDAMRDLRDGF